MYLTCVVREIYVPLILKFGCFVMFLSDLVLNNKMSVLLVLKDILFALSHVVRTFKPWLISLFIILKSYLQVVNIYRLQNGVLY